jgi:rhodanese-related sulfurtransferase
MKQNNNFSKVALILLLFTIAYSQAFSQQPKELTVFENVTEMVDAAKAVITEIPVHDFKEINDTKNPIVIDVRTAAEHKPAAIPGAVNIPRGVLEFRIANEEIWEEFGKPVPSKSDTIYVYCGSGSRGALSAKALMQLGYTNVFSVEDGWNAWHEAYPDLSN